jgi:K+-transporting ATPase ATPase C chain
MQTILRPCLGTFLALTLLTGVAYPLGVTVVAQLAFHEQASGSLLLRNGRLIGSKLLGQAFSRPEYFWSRPSATSPHPYNGGASSGSNLGPTNPALLEAVRQRVTALLRYEHRARDRIPVDLVTASGSGLDPHISPAAADYQVARVAHARNVPESQVRRLVAAHTEARTLGVLGEPRVNVLELNLALDSRL